MIMSDEVFNIHITFARQVNKKSITASHHPHPTWPDTVEWTGLMIQDLYQYFICKIEPI